jgi:soluble P-type ATPase
MASIESTKQPWERVMTLKVEIPGRETLSLEHLLLDQNGTLSNRGELIGGVAERLARLRSELAVHILTADTFGTLEEVVAQLGVSGERVASGVEKRTFVERAGGESCVAIGNGNNDVSMFESCALSIAVTGPEGASTRAILAAQIVCASITDALDLLLEPRVLVATLRS